MSNELIPPGFTLETITLALVVYVERNTVAYHGMDVSFTGPYHVIETAARIASAATARQRETASDVSRVLQGGAAC